MDSAAVNPADQPTSPAQPPVATPPGRITNRTGLDRGLDLSAVSWWTIGWIAIVVTGIALRFSVLNIYALSAEEARRSFFAFSLVQGNPLLPGEALPDTAPLFLLLQALSLFLFGATDATARLIPALAGIAMIPLAAALRPFVGRHAAFAMGLLIALSPTLTYASRIAAPGALAGMLAMLLLVAVLRAGLPDISTPTVRRWAAIAGVALAALIASGPAAISVLLGLAGGVFACLALAPKTQPNAVRLGLRTIVDIPGALSGAIAAAIATLMLLFTRLFTDLSTIAGLAGTFADWLQLLVTNATSSPVQIFFLIVLLYEVLAVLFAIVATQMRPALPDGIETPLDWSFFGGWFVTTLILFSFSEGRQPDQAIHVVLPLVLLAGMGLGAIFATVNWPSLMRGQAGLLFLALLGAVVGLAAVGVLATRIDGGPGVTVDQTAAIIQTVVVAIIVFGGFLLAAATLIRAARSDARTLQPGRLLLLVLLLVLGAYTLRSTTTLAFFRADEGTEFLAQETATSAVGPVVERMQRLSRDVSIDRSSVRDPIGTYGLQVGIDQRVQWPYRWYFRRFADVSITAPGRAQTANAEVVIAPDETGLPEAGYTLREYPYLNRVPAAYTTPDLSDIFLDIVLPNRWMDGIDFLLYREIAALPPAQTVEVGFNQEIANRLFPNSGPYGLLDRVGPGTGRGQFNGPRGIAVDPAGNTTYVVDSGNLQIDRFDAAGAYIGSWGGDDTPGGIQFGSLVLEDGGILGPAGITVAPDGVVYVADTWNHRLAGLNADGTLVREIGAPGERTDLGDDPATLEQSPGLFFGPRDVMILNDEIYVVDTGNERIQVFGLDGSFRRVFGGYGTEPGRLLEPVGITAGPEGRIYVADSGNARISIFQANGIPITQWPIAAWDGQQYFEPYLAFGPDGLLYATSRATGQVIVLDGDGAIVETLDSINNVPLDGPLGITSAPDGSLLITDAALSAILPLVPIPSDPPSNTTTDNTAAQPATPTPPPAAAATATPAPTEAATPTPAPTEAATGPPADTPTTAPSSQDSAAPTNQAPPPPPS